MYPNRRQGKHYWSQNTVDETQRGGNYTELIGAKESGLTFIAHGNDYARTSLRNGSMECPAKDFGGSRSRFAVTEAEAQSKISRYMSRPAILPNHCELVSDAITTTFGFQLTILLLAFIALGSSFRSLIHNRSHSYCLCRTTSCSRSRR